MELFTSENKMPDEACRLAKVEQRIENLEEIFEDRGKKLDAIIATLEEMKSDQTRYKGFLGGIVFTVGAVFSFLSWWLGSR